MNKIVKLAEKTVNTLRQDGVGKVYEKSRLYIKKKKEAKLEEEYTKGCMRDILFVNGCDEHLPHPGRYRVTHQREQLESLGFSTGEIYFQNIDVDILRYYRTVLFFRCPYTEPIGEVVRRAKELNKTLLYDIDDLVFDTKYTNLIPYLQTVSIEEKKQYDENVENMGKLLKLCDGAVTTTGRLAAELKKYVPRVVINRNTASEEMVKLSLEALKKEQKDGSAVRIGYFSGSITHNEDFQMILPVLTRLLEKYGNLELCLAGELDLPEELKVFEKQISRIPFGDWRTLPDGIAAVDINIAPLLSNIFNEAKSENKWLEAALVKVPTVASDFGAFHEKIQNGKNGLLCRNLKEWEECLERLILDRDYRESLGSSAYEFCSRYCTTAVTGQELADFLTDMEKWNVMFILPGFQVSGGVMVALQHACILQDSGRDVALLSIDENGRESWYSFEKHLFPVLNLNSCKMKSRIDWCVGTMWSTCQWFSRMENIRHKGYLVQNYEPDFYAAGDPLRMQARATYGIHPDWNYLTISRWCEKWLKEEYGHETRFAPNGLSVEKFRLECRSSERCTDFAENKKTGRIRILIEGDSSAPHKNVDESFKIVEKLDPLKFEIWYMAYHGAPKEWYRVDKFLPEVPYERVQEIYHQCDILLKSSILESFSYPPLEMMAGGGLVVAVQNDGNREYLKDKENCLIYPKGDIEAGKNAVLRICQDEKLCSRLRENGKKTAEQRDWNNLIEEIINLYM